MRCAGRAERWVIAARPGAVRGLLLELERAEVMRGLTVDERECTLLVLAEVMNNIVKHGYGDRAGAKEPGWIAVLPGPGERGLGWRVLDGAAIPLPEACRKAVLPPVDMEGGFGWPLILALTQSVTMRRWAGCNVLSLQMRRGSAAQNKGMRLAKIA